MHRRGAYKNLCPGDINPDALAYVEHRTRVGQSRRFSSRISGAEDAGGRGTGGGEGPAYLYGFKHSGTGGRRDVFASDARSFPPIGGERKRRGGLRGRARDLQREGAGGGGRRPDGTAEITNNKGSLRGAAEFLSIGQKHRS